MTANDATTTPEAPSAGRLRLGTCPDSWGVWFADDPLLAGELARRTYYYLRGVGIGSEQS